MAYLFSSGSPGQTWATTRGTLCVPTINREGEWIPWIGRAWRYSDLRGCLFHPGQLPVLPTWLLKLFTFWHFRHLPWLTGFVASSIIQWWIH